MTAKTNQQDLLTALHELYIASVMLRLRCIAPPFTSIQNFSEWSRHRSAMVVAEEAIKANEKGQR
jgi:hypothetical protein